MAIDTETRELQSNATIDVDLDATSPLGDGLGPDEAAEPAGGDNFGDEGRLPTRAIIAVALSTISAAMMVGGVFLGASPRVDAAFAGLLGVLLAVGVSRMRRPASIYIVMVGGLFVVGLLAMLPYGPQHLGSLRTEITQAVSSGKVLRPPTEYSPAWAAIVGWVMGLVAFAATWTATVVRKPSFAVLVPLPLTAIAGISLPSADQVPTGIAAVAILGVALGVLASSQLSASEGGLPLRYELRRGAKGLALMAVVTAALAGAAQSDLLFPHPAYDPTHHPEKPHTSSLSSVPDTVLFEVSNTHVSGPWVLGVLDEYDGQDWRLPAFADTQLQSIPTDGIVDTNLQAGAKATFTVRNLTGAVLPGMPNTVAIEATGPVLKYDKRTGTIRLFEGQFQNGFSYEVAAAALNSVDSLKALGNDLEIPDSVQRFEAVPVPPDAVKKLLDKAPKGSKFEEFDWVRHWVLDNVVADGPGVPVSIPPSRVQEILTQKTGSPYEIVATQALLARWMGLPSRIGYGFDGGKQDGDHLEVHPSNGAAFPEVYFPGHGWLPVMGTPTHAKAHQGKNLSQTNINVLPSDNIGVDLYIPEITPTSPPFTDTLKAIALVIVAVLLLALIVFLTVPVVAKLLRRQRRRAEAERRGPRAQIALAYSDWRDHAADFGYAFPGDTPLMFAERFVDDEEHRQFAWLVTRALWGDLGTDLTPELALEAQTFSGSLRRRLSQARPITVRAVALFSWRSLRRPYDAEDVAAVRAGRNGRRAAA